MLSVSICRISLNREAPSAIRIDVSDLRANPRTSTRFAMFAHAISSTSPTIAIIIRNGLPYRSAYPGNPFASSRLSAGLTSPAIGEPSPTYAAR